MMTKPKTNTNQRTQLNLSKLCTYTDAWERENKEKYKKKTKIGNQIKLNKTPKDKINKKSNNEKDKKNN